MGIVCPIPTPEDRIVQSYNLCAVGLRHWEDTVFAVLSAPGNPEVTLTQRITLCYWPNSSIHRIASRGCEHIQYMVYQYLHL